MRKLIYSINMSLDGYCDHTLFNPDDELLDYFTQLTKGADTFVYGRKTYELMVPYWPGIAKDHSGQTRADIEFALAFDAVNKIVVFSKTIERAEAENTTVVHTDLKGEILKLKQEEGRYILTGGVDISSQLIALGLIDEYCIVVHPLIAGAGRRMTNGMNVQERLALKLIESKVFKSGCVALRYAKEQPNN